MMEMIASHLPTVKIIPLSEKQLMGGLTTIADVSRGGDRLGYLLGLILGLCGLGLSAGGIASPRIAHDLDVAKATTAWVVNCFALGLAVGTIVAGRMLDLVARAVVLHASAVVMLLGAGICGAADGFGVLLIGRVLIGLGAGGLCSFAFLVGVRSTGYDRQGRIAGLMTAMSVAFIGAGPLLGSLALAVADWRLAVGLPAVAAPVALLLSHAGRDRPPTQSSSRLDLRGVLLVTVVAAGIAGTLQSVGTSGGMELSAPVAALTLAGLALLVRHVRRRPDGFLPKELLGNRPLLMLNLCSMTLLGSYAGMLYAAPILLQTHARLGPLAAGAALAPAAVTAATGAYLAGGVIMRVAPANVIAGLCGLAALGLLVAGIATAKPVAIVLATALTASAFAAGQVTMQVSASALVPAGEVGASLGLFNFFFISGAALGTSAVAGVSNAAGFSAALAGLAVVPALAGALVRGTRRRRC